MGEEAQEGNVDGLLLVEKVINSIQSGENILDGNPRQAVEDLINYAVDGGSQYAADAVRLLDVRIEGRTEEDVVDDYIAQLSRGKGTVVLPFLTKLKEAMEGQESEYQH